MLGSYLTMGLRRLRRFPGQGLAAITCLAVSIAVCLLIGLFLRFELSYDDHHPGADRLYRLNWINRGTGARFATFFNPVSPLLADGLPQIEAFSRLMLSDQLMEIGEERFFSQVSLVDAQYFSLFDYPVLSGNTDAIQAPDAAVITEAAAQLYFGSRDALGRTFTLDDRLTFRVVAVVANNPASSHLVSNLFINIETLPQLFERPDFWNNLGSDVMYHYVRLAPGTSPEQTATAAKDYLLGELPLPGEFSQQIDIAMQSLSDIHFTADLQNEMAIRDDVRNLPKPHRPRLDLFLFAGVAVLTLIIGIFNFVNLQLAVASLRARELGVRRALGASRGDVSVQFMTESTFLCALALLLALALAAGGQGYFSRMVAAEVDLASLQTFGNFLAFLGFITVLALVAGAYPAWIMARLSPVVSLGGQVTASISNTGMRSGLVVLQFAISIGLLIASAVVSKQLDFAQTKSLGFDPNNTVMVDLGLPEADSAYVTLRAELLRHAAIETVSAGSILPTQSLSDGAIFNQVTDTGLDTLTTRRISVADDYFSALDMSFVAGRPLSSERSNDVMPTIGPDNLEVSGGVVFNETAARAAGWQDPADAIGQNLFSEFAFSGNQYRMNYTVVGVVEDAHYGSVRSEIVPLSFTLDNNRSQMLVEVRAGAMNAALLRIGEVWESLVPELPLRQVQLGEEYAALYAGENRIFIVFVGMTAIAVIMACFGLYGLASLIAQARRKELSIRKVLGATVAQLMALMTWRICRLVLLANLVAWPAAYWVMQNWLDNFAYRIVMDPWLFIGASLAALTIAFLTTASQTWGAATTSPIHALRTE